MRDQILIPIRPQALSDFAEYVEQQQSLRFPASKAAKDKSVATIAEDHHEELDELFDNLDLADTVTRIELKSLLLAADDDEDSLIQLQDLLVQRVDEGMGEDVFELGCENNGDSMDLTLDQWNTAYARLIKAAEGIGAKCQLLLTHNVGGEVEAAENASTISSKDKSCTGKVLVRRIPAKIEEAIETRIAVVGNGKYSANIPQLCDVAQANITQKLMLERVPCWES